MMAGQVALCVDEITCKNPELIGLDGESIELQEWLDVFTAGDLARHAIGEEGRFDEAWVASCDDVDPINLAATLKRDRPGLTVRLVVDGGCGSLLSRAHTAAIDEVVELSAFARLYGDAKARFGATTLAFEQQAVEREAAAPTLAPVALARPMPLVATQGRGFVMPVVSGSGGAGKSCVSALLACIARDSGFKTLLLDYDLQFGDVAAMVGLRDCLSVDEAIRHPERFQAELAGDPRFMVLAAPPRLEQAEQAVRGIPNLLDAATREFDVVIANTGGAWAEQHAALLERSHVALFLIDQRASSIRACKHALDLCARCGIATGPFEFALNRCSKGAPLTSADVSSALQGAPVLELRDGGREVEEYLGAGAADDLLRSGNEFAESLKQLAQRLLPDSPASAVGATAERAEGRLLRRRGRHAGRKRGRKS